MINPGICRSIRMMGAAALLAILGGCALSSGEISPSADETGQPREFGAGALEGYWTCRNDGVEVHITQVGPRSTGNGSYKDVSGRLIPAGKFSGIRYLGGNRWECQQWIQRPGQLYDPERGRWEPAIIEMIDINTLKVGSVIYSRI